MKRKILFWFGVFLLQAIAMALLNHWRPTMGLGDVLYFVVFGVWFGHYLAKPENDREAK
jgi:hypothetical protein